MPDDSDNVENISLDSMKYHHAFADNVNKLSSVLL